MSILNFSKSNIENGNLNNLIKIHANKILSGIISFLNDNQELNKSSNKNQKLANNLNELNIHLRELIIYLNKLIKDINKFDFGKDLNNLIELIEWSLEFSNENILKEELIDNLDILNILLFHKKTNICQELEKFLEEEYELNFFDLFNVVEGFPKYYLKLDENQISSILNIILSNSNYTLIFAVYNGFEDDFLFDNREIFKIFIYSPINSPLEFSDSIQNIDEFKFKILNFIRNIKSDDSKNLFISFLAKNKGIKIDSPIPRLKKAA